MMPCFVPLCNLLQLLTHVIFSSCSSAGCRFGEACHSRDSGQQAVPKTDNPDMATPASFGASATAKISVDASVAGAIIGRGGANIKQMSRVTGTKLVIRDHESDASLKNIELEGTFDQIKEANTMVKELIVNAPPPGSKFRTRLCEHFARGSCTYGDRCRFAHGEDELRKYVSSEADATKNFWAHGEFPSRKGGW